MSRWRQRSRRRGMPGGGRLRGLRPTSVWVRSRPPVRPPPSGRLRPPPAHGGSTRELRVDPMGACALGWSSPGRSGTPREIETALEVLSVLLLGADLDAAGQLLHLVVDAAPLLHEAPD